MLEYVSFGEGPLRRFTPEEAQRLVQAIARSLEDPLQGPLCRPRRAGRPD